MKKKELLELFNTLKPYPLMRTACMVLCDLAARVQDLVLFQYDSFKLEKNGLGSCSWVCSKTKEPRDGSLTPETMRALRET